MRLVAAFFLVLGALVATPPAQAADERISMNHRNTDVGRLLRQLGPQLGERFLFEPTISGRVTIAVPRPVSREVAFQLLHAALQLRGYAVVPLASGGYKVVPLPATSSTARWTTAPPDPDSEEHVVTLLRLEHASAELVSATMRPLLNAASISIPLTGSNSLIVGTRERNLAGIIELLRELDRPGSSLLTVRRLQYRAASELESIIDSNYGETVGASQGVDVWSDERTNTLIYRAGPTRRGPVAALIDQLDVPERSEGELVVLPLRFAQAATVAEHLRELNTPAPATGAASAAGVASRSQRIGGLVGAGLNVVPDEQTNTLLINALPETLRLIRALVDELDQPPRQIALDIQIVELRHENDFALDFKLALPLATGGNPPNVQTRLQLGVDAGGIPASPGPEVGTTLARLDFPPIVIPDPAGGPATVIAQTGAVIADARVVESSVLLNPTLVAMAGEEHSFFSGNNIPIPRASSGENTGPLQVNTTIDRTDTGVELVVRPSVGSEGEVVLELDLDLTRLAPSLAQGALDQVGPTLSQQRIQTTARLHDGELLTIATIAQPLQTEIVSGTPFLKDLPFVGFLFRSIRRTTRQQRVLVTAQARVLQTPDQHLAYSIHKRIAYDRALERRAALDAPGGSAWAVLADTEADRASAAATAARLDSELRPARVVEWREEDGPLFDVYLVGFESYADAAEEATLLEREGYTAEVVPAVATLELLNSDIR